jgi:lipopolysaccharide cholinephosphotransferase
MTSKNKLNNLTFPVHEGYGFEEIKKVQQVVLDMGRMVCSILERNKIPYMITNGTLIGAALYQSFVPWDDDFDLFLFDDTYEEAMRALEDELPAHLIVHSERNDPKYFPAWNRVKDIRTYTEDSGLYNPDNRILRFPCLSVDLYRIKRMPKSRVELYKVCEALKFFERKHKFGIISSSMYNKEVQLLQQEKGNLESQHFEGYDDDVYMFMVMLRRPLSAEDIFPLLRYSFEGYSFWGPQSSDALLSSLYGKDYKCIPEFEQRNTRFSKVSCFSVPYFDSNGEMSCKYQR